MNFEIISEITDIETIAVGRKIRDLARLRRIYGVAKVERHSAASPEER